MTINFKKLSSNAKPPFRATENSAGSDLFAQLTMDNGQLTIGAGQRMLINTGIAVEVPAGYGGFIFPRSSISAKHGVSLANCVGVIDADYRGEVKVSLINHSDTDYTVKDGDRIAQLLIMPIEPVDFTEKSTLSDTKRGVGGFGSTGL
jgi:dUTP pyrophosphatase